MTQLTQSQFESSAEGEAYEAKAIIKERRNEYLVDWE
jgi:hypothetical protein